MQTFLFKFFSFDALGHAVLQILNNFFRQPESMSNAPPLWYPWWGSSKVLHLLWMQITFSWKLFFFSLQKPCDSDVTAISIESYGLNIALLSVSLVTHLYYNPCLRPPSMKQWLNENTTVGCPQSSTQTNRGEKKLHPVVRIQFPQGTSFSESIYWI